MILGSICSYLLFNMVQLNCPLSFQNTDFADKEFYCFQELNQQLSHSKTWTILTFDQIFEILVFQKQYQMFA